MAIRRGASTGPPNRGGPNNVKTLEQLTAPSAPGPGGWIVEPVQLRHVGEQPVPQNGIRIEEQRSGEPRAAVGDIRPSAPRAKPRGEGESVQPSFRPAQRNPPAVTDTDGDDETVGRIDDHSSHLLAQATLSRLQPVEISERKESAIVQIPRAVVDSRSTRRAGVRRGHAVHLPSWPPRVN